MKSSSTRLPDLTCHSFVRTNAQTIAQRVVLLCEFAPNAKAISEICCGDYLGNALDVNVVWRFIDDGVIFFGPPLSERLRWSSPGEL